MRMKIISFCLFSTFLFTQSLFAMEYKEAKLVLWKNGEALYGDEFVIAKESVVDYIATLERPDSGFKTIAYKCQVKTRTISPRVWLPAGTGNVGASYTYITHAYDIKDCFRI